VSTDRFQLPDVRFVKRIVVGSDNPEQLKTEADIAMAADLLNRCFSDFPRGRIIATEKSFSLLNIGEHQVVLQHVVYHVAFSRKPAWLD